MGFGFGVVKHDEASSKGRQVYGGLSDRICDVIGKMGLSIDMVRGHCNLQEQHCFTSARYVRCWRCINWFFDTCFFISLAGFA